MKPGTVLLIRFPFANLESAKKRPALLLAIHTITPRTKIVTLAMITSKVDTLHCPGDVQLKDWQKANLLHPSLVRLAKIATVDAELIERQLGKLSVNDLKTTKKAFRSLFGFWLEK